MDADRLLESGQAQGYISPVLLIACLSTEAASWRAL